MSVDLVLLAGGASFNVSLNEGGQAWPPELGGYQLACFQDAGVSSSGMVMMSCHSCAVKFKVIGDIYLFFV